jgi:hypothetical protein
MSLVGVRCRQLPTLTQRLRQVVPWRPVLTAGIIGLVVVAATPRVGGDPYLRLRLAGVAMAATVAFVLDDRAAATLASSPVTLIERRALRMIVVVPIVAMWWHGLVLVLSIRRPEPLPRASALWLEALMYCALGLAACVWSQRRSDDGAGGTAGAVLVAITFGSSVIPLPAWWPLTPGGSAELSWKLQLVVACAGAVVVAGSRDPASMRPVRVRRA